jgi:hypothetical protein
LVGGLEDSQEKEIIISTQPRKTTLVHLGYLKKFRERTFWLYGQQAEYFQLQKTPSPEQELSVSLAIHKP